MRSVILGAIILLFACVFIARAAHADDISRAANAADIAKAAMADESVAAAPSANCWASDRLSLESFERA